ncbi:hypothetical protein Hanom_Chr01g00046221 [Helianthus anomalus]
MKDKGKEVQVENVVQMTERAIIPTKFSESPCPITSVPGEYDEEDDDDNLKDDADEVYSVHSEDDDDGNDDADQGTSGIKVNEASKDENIDEYLQDNANEEPENARGEGEHGDIEKVDENVDQSTAEILKMMVIEDSEFNFDFEEELNKFDINHQPEYQYKYVEDADNYDKMEVEDWSDDDQSKMLIQANEDELRRKVAESVNNKSFKEMSKEEQHEERKKWFKKDTERKFKRPPQYYRRDRNVSLGDIISWGYLPQVNAYAIQREFGVQYFQYIQDIMSLPWWDVEELSQVGTLSYPPHYPKKVKRVDPVTGIEEIIPHIKKPRVLKNIPLPKMEHNFHEGFICWVYSCISTEVVIEYRVGNEIRNIHLYDPMWIMNCSTKDIECLFVNKIGYKVEDREQALQFQKVATICFQKGINSENMWLTRWSEIEKEEALKTKKLKEEREEKDKIARATILQRLAEEEKRVAEENEKLRKMLLRNPKQREEFFKSL